MKKIFLFIIFVILSTGTAKATFTNSPASSLQTEQTNSLVYSLRNDPFSQWQTYAIIFAFFVIFGLLSALPWSNVDGLLLWAILIIGIVIDSILSFILFKSGGIFFITLFAIAIGIGFLGQILGGRLEQSKKNIIDTH